MIRFGIVGTSWISDTFIEAGLKLEDFSINAVYSRRLEKAKEFGEKYRVENYFDSLEVMAKSGTIDAVYIASPNSLHVSQAKLFAENNIACFIEKPIASTPEELNSLINIAKETNTLVMEGMLTTQTPNFKILKDRLERIGAIRKATLFFCQYSSKYDKWKNGVYTNAFDPKWTNGALMDIGVYPVSAAIGLFGKPTSITGSATLLPNSIDGEGNLVLEYNGFHANIIYSKIANGYLPSEIQGELGAIHIYNLPHMKKLELILKDGSKELISIEQEENPMYYEIKDFIETLQRGDIESKVNTFENSYIVQGVLREGRRLMGFSFPADIV